ncbi:MAG: CoA transferase subunit A [Candidatus Wallbacteria bacterium HGW-Wallbacteria-1]|jgi:glutaconate CoA-transferase subunit A|uniref:CoA transferase subunit A n=1 Tax=Candidatus Wallbacteria bacterium HGW-Wallbacteria-1 TaxID=2013854 RepID=A0A2N1PKY3_9BACT|nr:MAG: CoA transferase subunit A [Candidatus Wallbacteria bacterium HGW-Wallbacteria-1]
MSEKELKQGIGEIFTDVDPDAMRNEFRKKNKRLVSKITTVSEAIEKHVHDGDYLAIGGFGGVRIPTALIHEVLRQGRKNLGFAGHVATHDCQLLCAGKCFDRCDAAYIVGLEARGLSPNARAVFQSGQIKVTEWSNGALSWRFKAAAMGLSFLPCRSILGTDTFNYSAAREMKCPFTGKTYAAVPALYPDVAFIHVSRADIYGNCQIDGIVVADDDIAKAAKRVIVTTEKLVENSEIRREPNRTIIPYWLVDAVIEVPFGSYPGNMPGEYFSDEEHINEWLKIEKDPEGFSQFLEKNIYSCRNFSEYLEKNGGIEKLRTLRQQEHLLK